MHYQDIWKKHIPPEKRAVYKRLLTERMIENIHLTYVRATGETIVEFDSELTEAELMGLKRRYSHGDE